MTFTISYFKTFNPREKIEYSSDDENCPSETSNASDSLNSENSSGSFNLSNNSTDTSSREDPTFYILFDSQVSKISRFLYNIYIQD